MAKGQQRWSGNLSRLEDLSSSKECLDGAGVGEAVNQTRSLVLLDGSGYVHTHTHTHTHVCTPILLRTIANVVHSQALTSKRGQVCPDTTEKAWKYITFHIYPAQHYPDNN